MRPAQHLGAPHDVGDPLDLCRDHTRGFSGCSQRHYTVIGEQTCT